MNTIIGTKGNMTQVFVNDRRVPVTKIMAGPCVVTQIKHMDKDGYWAVQFGLNTKRAKNTSKPLQGHLQKVKQETKFPRTLKEVRFSEEPNLKVGDIVNVADIFGIGDVVAVAGVSKGKGFQGGVRRYNFRGGPRTHGQSDRERAPGSIGQTTTPGRVYKGKRMAGRMGTDTVTVKNLHIIGVNKETGEILVSGAVPGRIGTLLTIIRLSAGSLKDLEKEAPAAAVFEEAPAEGAEAEKATEAPKTEGAQA